MRGFGSWLIYIYIYVDICKYIYLYIYLYARTSTPLRHAKMHFLVPKYPQSHRATDPEIPKIQKSKNPNFLQESVDVIVLDSWIFLVLDVWNFWNFVFWILRIVDLDTRNCICVYCRCLGWVIPHIYICTIHTCAYVHWLNQAYAVAQGYLAKR